MQQKATIKVEYRGDQFIVQKKDLSIQKDGVTLNVYLNKKLNRFYIFYITKDGKRTLVPRARIICQAFHPNENYQELFTDHIDSNTTNDDPSNLRWVTRKENNSTEHARMMKKMNAKCTRHSNEVIHAICIATGEEKFIANGRECAEFLHCSAPHIYMMLDEARKLGKPKTVKGWKLEWTTSVKDDVLTEVKAVRKAEVNLSNGRLESAIAHAKARLKMISKMNKKRRKRLANTRLREGHPRRVATENMLKKMEKRQKTLELEVEAMQKLLKGDNT